MGGRLPKASVSEDSTHFDSGSEARDNAGYSNAQSPPFVLYKQQARFERAETEVLDPERAGHGSKDFVKLSVVP